MQLTGFSTNKCYIACAGAGKTTLLVNEACARANSLSERYKQVCIITFTAENQENVRQRLKNTHNRETVTVYGWFEFLLKCIARPFKTDIISSLLNTNLRLNYVTEPSGKIYNKKQKRWVCTYAKNDIKSKFLTKNESKIHSDKLSEFCYECYKINNKLLITHLENIFDSIYIDEAQDMIGYDLEIIKILVKSKIHIVLAGDPRQHTYDTHISNKHFAYKGHIELFCKDKINTHKKTYIEVDRETLSSSWRCPPTICEIANSVSPSFPAMTYKGDAQIQEQFYLVKESDSAKFLSVNNFIVLVWDKTSHMATLNSCYNMGEVKGLEFNDVLVCPTKTMIEWMIKGKSLAPITEAKFYVAITRAKRTLAILVPDNFSTKRFNYNFWSAN